MYGSWDMECNIIFSHFGLFFALYPPPPPPHPPLTTQKIKILKVWKKCLGIPSLYTSAQQMAIIWCMVPEIWHHDMRQTDIILDHFLPFYLTKNPKNQISENMKKMPGNIIILLKCTKNHDMLCSWDLACDRCNFYFSFWAIFYPFTILTAQKNKLLKRYF